MLTALRAYHAPRRLVRPPEPLERPRQLTRLRDVALDPAPAREPAVRADPGAGEGALLVRARQPHPEVVVLGPDRVAAEHVVAHEVAPPPEHRRDPRAVPLGDRVVEHARRSPRRRARWPAGRGADFRSPAGAAPDGVPRAFHLGTSRPPPPPPSPTHRGEGGAGAVVCLHLRAPAAARSSTARSTRSGSSPRHGSDSLDPAPARTVTAGPTGRPDRRGRRAEERHRRPADQRREVGQTGIVADDDRGALEQRDELAERQVVGHVRPGNADRGLGGAGHRHDREPAGDQTLAERGHPGPHLAGSPRPVGARPAPPRSRGPRARLPPTPARPGRPPAGPAAAPRAAAPAARACRGSARPRAARRPDPACRAPRSPGGRPSRRGAAR